MYWSKSTLGKVSTWGRILIVLLTLLVCASLITSCGPDYIKHYDTPLTFTQAMKEKDIGIPLPKSAHNINYAMYADGQTYERFVRFEAPVEDCIKHIDVVLAWHDKMFKRTSSYDPRHISSVAPHGGDKTMGPTPWFDVDKTVNGLYIGEDEMLKPQIWIDLDRGIFYFMDYH